MKLNPEADKEIRDILLEREGRRKIVYEDTTGNKTIGIGHKNLPDEDFTTIDDAKIDELFESDLQKAIGFADTIIKEQNITATENDRMALTLMSFQLGIGDYDEKSGVRGFTDTLKYLSEGDREAAAIEAANSKWATQTPKRLKDFQMLMRRGVDKMKGGFIDMEDGGEVPSLVSDTPFTTIESPLANKTDTTEYDTTQGFYSVNPTPNETKEQFETRVPPTEAIPYEPTPQTEIPEGYVNPRSQGFLEPDTSPRIPRPTSGAISQTNAANNSETSEDRAADNLVRTVVGLDIIDSGFQNIAQNKEDFLNYKTENNMVLDTFNFPKDTVSQESYNNMVESFGQEEVDRMGLEVGGLWHQNLIDHPDIGLDYSVEYNYETGKYDTTRTFNYNKPGYVLHYGKSYAVDDIINGFNKGDPAFVSMYNELKSMTGPVDLSKKTVQGIKDTQVTYVDGVVDGPLSIEDVNKKTKSISGWETDEEFQEFLTDSAGKPEGKDLNILQRTSNNLEDWWNTEIEITLPFFKDKDGNPLKDSSGIQRVCLEI